MKVSKAIAELQKILDEHGDLDFATWHTTKLCRVEHDNWIYCNGIFVWEGFRGALKMAVAK